MGTDIVAEVAAQWDDAILDRIPQEQGVAIAVGGVFGASSLANTRLQFGLTPAPHHRVGFGVSGVTQLNAVWVVDEDRVGVGVGGSTVDLHCWSGPRNHRRTTHDGYLGATLPLRSETYLVRIQDGAQNLHIGYAGYYDLLPYLDVSLDLQAGWWEPVPGASSWWEVFGAAGVTAFISTNKERWVAVVGLDVSMATTAAQLGYRRRFGRGWEAGAAVVVPLYTDAGLSQEVPSWPVIDLRWRLAAADHRTQ